MVTEAAAVVTIVTKRQAIKLHFGSRSKYFSTLASLVERELR